MKFQLLKEPVRLVIHRDQRFSIRIRRGCKWRWEHGLVEITQSQFRRLPREGQRRIRRLEECRGVTLVVADYPWEQP